MISKAKVTFATPLFVVSGTFFNLREWMDIAKFRMNLVVCVFFENYFDFVCLLFEKIISLLTIIFFQQTNQTFVN